MNEERKGREAEGEVAHLAPGELKILSALNNPVCKRCSEPFPYWIERCRCRSRLRKSNPRALRFKDLARETGLDNTSLSNYLKHLQDLGKVARDYHERKYTILDPGNAELHRAADHYQISISHIPNYLIRNPKFAPTTLLHYRLGEFGEFEHIVQRRASQIGREQLAEIFGLARAEGLIPARELGTGNISNRTLRRIRKRLFPELERVLFVERWDIGAMFQVAMDRDVKPFFREIIRGELPDYRAYVKKRKRR